MMTNDTPPEVVKIEDARRKRGGRGAVRAAIANAQPAAARPDPAPGADGGARLVMLETGLHRRTDDGLRLVAGRFDVLAQTRDEHGGEWGLLIQFADPDGAQQKVVITRDLFTGERNDVAAILARRGLFVQPGRQAAAALSEFLAAAVRRATGRVRVVSRTGWHVIDGRQVFVLPSETLGGAEGAVLFSPDTDPPPFNAAGTLADWQAGVAARCVGNRLLVLGVCTALAAPLLGVLGEQGGGFHLHGNSSSGKTTALRVAASVWGGEGPGGAAGYVRQWRATGNGVEGIAQAHSDTLLAMDEIGTADPATIGEVAYMLANGRGRERLDRSGKPRRPARFRSLFFSTGEPSFADVLAEARRHARAGQEVRMVDVSADAGANLGVFQDLHGAQSGDAFAAELARAVALSYGTAGPAFVRHLAERLQSDQGFTDHLRGWVADLVRGWLAAYPGAGGQVMNVAQRFALAAVAGELAEEAGLTRWGASEAQESAEACFKAWLAERGIVGAREDAQAVAQLRNFISLHGASRFELWLDRAEDDAFQGDPDAKPPPTARVPVVNRAGWRRWVATPGGGHGWRYFLLPAAMAEALAGLDRRSAHRVLIGRGFLIPGRDGRAARSLPAPGFGQVRLYEVTGEIMDAADGAD